MITIDLARFDDLFGLKREKSWQQLEREAAEHQRNADMHKEVVETAEKAGKVGLGDIMAGIIFIDDIRAKSEQKQADEKRAEAERLRKAEEAKREHERKEQERKEKEQAEAAKFEQEIIKDGDAVMDRIRRGNMKDITDHGAGPPGIKYA